MKTALHYLLFLLPALILSCNNESLDNNPEVNQSKILKKVTTVLIDPPNNCTGREALFNAEGKIEGIYLCGVNTPNRVHTYTETGKVKSISNYPSFIYENDILVARSGGTDTGGSYTEISYEENAMTIQGFYNQEINDFYYRYVFEDNSYKKLLYFLTIHTANDVEEITRRTTYSYDNGNIVKILLERKEPNDAQIEPKASIEFTYDNKINPYVYGMSTNGYVRKSVPLIYVDVDINFARFSLNNITSWTFNNLIENTSYGRSYDYVYDENMHPIIATESINGIPRLDFLFEYYD